MTSSCAPRAVLLIEDDARYVRMLGPALRRAGYRPLWAGGAACGLQAAAASSPAAVVLKLDPPDAPGLHALERIQAVTTAPLIVTAAADDPSDGYVRALEAGADDYLLKPFAPAAMLARLRSVWSYAAAEPPPEGGVIVCGDLRLDAAARTVTVDGRAIDLSAAEFRLLAYLASRAGRVVTPRELLRGVWGADYAADAHLARVYVHRARQKIERAPADPRRLVTRPGTGYTLRGVRAAAP